LRIQALHVGGTIGTSQAQVTRENPPAKCRIVRNYRLQSVQAYWAITDQFIALFNAETVALFVNGATALDIYDLNHQRAHLH